MSLLIITDNISIQEGVWNNEESCMSRGTEGAWELYPSTQFFSKPDTALKSIFIKDLFVCMFMCLCVHRMQAGVHWDQKRTSALNCWVKSTPPKRLLKKKIKPLEDNLLTEAYFPICWKVHSSIHRDVMEGTGRRQVKQKSHTQKNKYRMYWGRGGVLTRKQKSE